MRRIVASLAAVLIAVALGACGGNGAEPDAPGEGVATPALLDLVLDFQPNAVHTGIYVAEQRGLFTERGVELAIREPGSSSDAPKLLRSGRSDLAILDIQDLALAEQSGFGDLVAVGRIVDGPLAAVIAGDRSEIEDPADLEGKTIGVTGLPSDDAVLASVLGSAGLGLDDVETVTIGFDSIAALSAGRVAAATAFWSAEGVALRELGTPTREFRVDDFGAPTYPELVIVTTREKLADEGAQIAATVDAIGVGYAATAADPASALDDLLAAVPSLDSEQQRAQLQALTGLLPEGPGFDYEVLEAWSRWSARFGIVEEPPPVRKLFMDAGAG